MRLDIIALTFAAIAPLAFAGTDANMGYDKRAKIRPACDMILVENPPNGYCRKFCFLCGPRVESDYSRVLEPGKQGMPPCLVACNEGKEWIPKEGVRMNTAKSIPHPVVFKALIKAKWEKDYDQDFEWVTASWKQEQAKKSAAQEAKKSAAALTAATTLTKTATATTSTPPPTSYFTRTSSPRKTLVSTKLSFPKTISSSTKTSSPRKISTSTIKA